MCIRDRHRTLRDDTRNLPVARRRILAARELAQAGKGADWLSLRRAAADAVDTLTVDRFFAEADTLAGDTIVVEGLCTHLCRHGGKKAFLEGADTTLVLRCEATAEAGGAFSPDCVGKTLVIKGVVAENRIDEAAVVEMERKYAENNEGHNCATDAKAQSQDTIDSFAARMADYRSRIAKNAEATGKAYISFYYLDAVSYDIK